MAAGIALLRLARLVALVVVLAQFAIAQIQIEGLNRKIIDGINLQDRERLANENYQRGRAMFEAGRHAVRLPARAFLRPAAARRCACAQEALPAFELAAEWARTSPAYVR